MQILSALIAGFVLGLGLLVSQMTNPAKVLNFLDVAGIWDPSLLLVIGGAVVTTLVGFQLLKKRSAPLFADVFHLPTKTEIDYRLLVGAALFGVGWGLGGLCPGPAVTSILIANLGIVVFIAAMIFGMWIERQITN